MRRLIVILAIGILALGFLITWFSGNFFYDLFWAFLEQHHIRQADVIAYTLAHATPFVLTAVVVVLLFFGIRYEVLRQQPKLPSGNFRAIQAQTEMADAIRMQAFELARHTAAIERNPKAPGLTIKLFGEGPAQQGGIKDSNGNELPVDWVFLAQLTCGDRALSKCQVILEDRHDSEFPLGGLFELRPGERKLVPIIRFKNRNPRDYRAFIYHVRPTDGQILADGPALLLGPERYRIKILSAEAPPAILVVHLSKHPTIDGQWILEEVPQ